MFCSTMMSPESAIVDPVAQTPLGGRSVGPRWAIDVAGEVVRFAANDVSERAIVDAADELNEGRTVANLESDIQAELAFGALADFDDAQRARDVHRHRLFEIDVLAGGYDGFKMLRMKVRRRGDHDGIDFLGVRDLLVCVGAEEKL